jgi:hypothetical protein
MLLPERSKEIDEVYGVLGRALSYACEFENNCRVLAHLFEILESKYDFMFEVEQLMENGSLFQKINSLVNLHELPNWTSEEIHKARKARNKIAHQVPLNHVRLINTPESIRSFETDILLTVQEIIMGNLIVIDVTRLLKESKRGFGSDVVAYHSKVCEWVLR